MDCLTVRLDLHQLPGVDVYGLAFEVQDAHTKELLAAMAEPTRRYPVGVSVARDVSEALCRVLLALTDPEPF